VSPCRHVLFFALVLLAGSGFAQQVFTEVAASMGISGQTGLGHSVAWCDIDNDRDIDVAFSNQDGSGFWLYRNDITSFVNITSTAGLGGLGASRVLWGEVTGDSFSDLILDTGSSQALYSNEGDNTFTNITSGSGLTGSPVCIADFYNDAYFFGMQHSLQLGNRLIHRTGCWNRRLVGCRMSGLRS